MRRFTRFTNGCGKTLANHRRLWRCTTCTTISPAFHQSLPVTQRWKPGGELRMERQEIVGFSVNPQPRFKLDHYLALPPVHWAGTVPPQGHPQ